MKITKISVKRPVTTFMFFMGVVLLGFVSLSELSVDLLPNINYPRLSVVTQYSGVAPEEMEILVTIPLEAAVSRIPGLRQVESVSKEEVSYLTLEFSWGTDMDFAMLHTREAIDSALPLLPEDVDDPIIIPLDPQSKPIMILSVSGDRSLFELKEFSEELIKPRLEQIEGIGSADIAGGLEREIHVEIDPELLSLYNLSIEDISSRIDAFNRNIQGGSIRRGRFRYALRIVGEFELVSEIGDISIKTTQERGIVRLKDVAQIMDSFKEQRGITRLNGNESIGILVRKESGANTVDVTGSVRDVLEEIRKEYPQVEILTVQEQAEYIENAISSVLNSIIFGGILAFFILIIFLQDLKTPLIIAAVIPISILATFNLLYFRDITLNIMSLGGLALGVGMFVDNSIVVSENIFRHKKQGKSSLDASITGAKEVGMAVTASTLTTISVFLPVVYVHGVAGQLFKDQAMTVAFALVSSLIVSLTLLPMLSSRKFKFDAGTYPLRENAVEGKDFEEKKEKKKFLLIPFFMLKKFIVILFKYFFIAVNFVFTFTAQAFLLLVHYISVPLKYILKGVFNVYNRIYQRFSSLYHRFLLWCLDNKVKVLFGSAAFLVITLFVSMQLPRELMPKPETTSFELQMKTPVDYSLEQTADVVSSIEEWMRTDDLVEIFFSQIGIVSGMESFNPDVSLNSAKIYVEVKNSSDVSITLENLREKLKKIPGLKFSLSREQATLSRFLALSTAEVGLKIKGDDLLRLEAIANQLVVKLKEIEGITDVNTNVGEGKPEFLVSIDKDSLQRYDISPAYISSFLVDAVRGRVATQFRELEKSYDIRVRLEEITRENIESLLDEKIAYRGTHIPLRELVSFTVSRGPKEIRRDNQQREVIITANLKGKKISEVVPEVMKKIDTQTMPQNYQVLFSGEQEEMTKSFKSLLLAFGLAVLLVYMIMAAQFESLLHPFLILFTLPMGMTGAVWALFLTGQSVNVVSIIGGVVLAGIVVNDAIVKIDYTNQLRRRGMSLRKAVLEASRVRLRPILMTTVTTAFGLLPMSLGLGRGSELQQPLAITVIGGLLLATFLTLILIPLTYEIAEKRRT
jgi:HAE1 family hydrophobic/amphiphilic exporter-1